MSVKSLAKPAFPASIERIRALAQRPRRRPQAPSQLGPPGLPVEFPVPGVLPAMAAGPAGLRRPHADALSRLVDRITQGFNAAEHARARTLGYEAYLEEQLDHLAIDDSAMDARLAGLTTLVMSPKQILDNFPMEIRTPYTEIKGAALLRSVFSRRQLFERMVEFWNDHFSLDHNKGDLMYVFKPEDDRLVVRPNVLGSFPSLLSASAHGAAMLFYLDNWLNIAGAPQENYARELMELHTLGVGGGYTEQDVREVAECFTGWTLNGDPKSANYLRALYEPSYHQGGNKVVLGVTIPATPGRENAQRVLDILTAHPSTAQFLSRKMIRWLLTETPPQSLVDQVAETYLDTAGDIKSMIRVILAQPNLERASPVFAPKYRRPFHLMTSLLRGLGADVTNFIYPLYYLGTMGHSPFDWSPPDGYPDKVDAWGHSLLPRWTFNSHLMQGYVLGVDLPLFELLEQLGVEGPNGHVGLAHRINRRILGGALSPEEEYMVQYFVDTLAAPLGWNEVYEAIALAASMPGYQWY